LHEPWLSAWCAAEGRRGNFGSTAEYSPVPAKSGIHVRLATTARGVLTVPLPLGFAAFLIIQPPDLPQATFGTILTALLSWSVVNAMAMVDPRALSNLSAASSLAEGLQKARRRKASPNVARAVRITVKARRRAAGDGDEIAGVSFNRGCGSRACTNWC
jgi:hypothetical protein